MFCPVNAPLLEECVCVCVCVCVCGVCVFARIVHVRTSRLCKG